MQIPGRVGTYVDTQCPQTSMAQYGTVNARRKRRGREKGGKNQLKSQGCETVMLLSRLFLGKKKKKRQRNKRAQDFLGRNGEQQGAETITKA